MCLKIFGGHVHCFYHQVADLSELCHHSSKAEENKEDVKLSTTKISFVATRRLLPKYYKP